MKYEITKHLTTQTNKKHKNNQIKLHKKPPPQKKEKRKKKEKIIHEEAKYIKQVKINAKNINKDETKNKYKEQKDKPNTTNQREYLIYR